MSLLACCARGHLPPLPVVAPLCRRYYSKYRPHTTDTTVLDRSQFTRRRLRRSTLPQTQEEIISDSRSDATRKVAGRPRSARRSTWGGLILPVQFVIDLQGMDIAADDDICCNRYSDYSNNNSNNNNQDDIYGVVIIAESHCESSPGSFGECRLSAGWPPTLGSSQLSRAVSPHYRLLKLA